VQNAWDYAQALGWDFLVLQEKEDILL